MPVGEKHQIVHSVGRDASMKKKLELVVFVGGVTWLEVAAIRQLKQLVVEEEGREV